MWFGLFAQRQVLDSLAFQPSGERRQHYYHQVNGKEVGSEHVGQQFAVCYFLKDVAPASIIITLTQKKTCVIDPETGGELQQGVASGGSNYGNSKLWSCSRPKRGRKHQWIFSGQSRCQTRGHSSRSDDSPGSGLDPDISPASAEIQVPLL